VGGYGRGHVSAGERSPGAPHARPRTGVSEQGVAIPRQRFSDHRGGLLLEVELAELWNGVGPCLALHRADLHAGCSRGRARCRSGWESAFAGCSSETGWSRSSSTTAPRPSTSSWSARTESSTVRRLAFGTDATARPVGQVGRRFVTACPSEITTWSVLLGHRTAFLMLPIGNGRVNCYCDVGSASVEEGDDDLVRLYSGFAEPVPSLLESVADPEILHRSTIGRGARARPAVPDPSRTSTGDSRSRSSSGLAVSTMWTDMPPRPEEEEKEGGGGARRCGSRRRRSRTVSSCSASACRATSPTECRARGSGQRRKGIGHPNGDDGSRRPPRGCNTEPGAEAGRVRYGRRADRLRTAL
jgi:hypothetical protein